MSHPSERIRARREELKLSQRELAQILGYTDRSAIAKIEKGVNSLTHEKIEAFAQALQTTPAYLLGWVEDSYDYSRDPENRRSLIPVGSYTLLEQKHKGDLRAIWEEWNAVQQHKEASTEQAHRVMDKEEIKFALFGGDGEITDAMYEEVLQFAAFVKNRGGQGK